MKKQGVGASMLRKEDDRFLRGRGQYVADLRLPGMKDVAFVRSPLAHARIAGVRIPDETRDRVYVAADLVGVKPIVAVSGLAGFKASEQPVLAFEKVRQVGELIAVCVGANRAEAEDIAATVELDLDELPALHDMIEARKPGAALVHEHWGDNVFLETFVDVNMEAAYDAPIKVTREISTARQSCSTPAARCRTSSAPASPNASASARSRSASSRRMSAAASATRASCCPRTSASPSSP